MIFHSYTLVYQRLCSKPDCLKTWNFPAMPAIQVTQQLPEVVLHAPKLALLGAKNEKKHAALVPKKSG